MLEFSALALRQGINKPKADIVSGLFVFATGISQAALEVMDERDVRESLVAAVRRAAERSRELGRGE